MNYLLLLLWSNFVLIWIFFQPISLIVNTNITAELYVIYFLYYSVNISMGFFKDISLCIFPVLKINDKSPQTGNVYAYVYICMYIRVCVHTYL